MNRLITIFLLLAVLLPAQSRAELTIEITQGVEGALPIAVVPFDSSATKYAPAEDIGLSLLLICGVAAVSHRCRKRT